MSSPIVSQGVSDAPASWKTIWGRADEPDSTLPLSDVGEPGDDRQQRRLAAAALADEGHRLAL